MCMFTSENVFLAQVFPYQLEGNIHDLHCIVCHGLNAFYVYVLIRKLTLSMRWIELSVIVGRRRTAKGI